MAEIGAPPNGHAGMMWRVWLCATGWSRRACGQEWTESLRQTQSGQGQTADVCGQERTETDGLDADRRMCMYVLCLCVSASDCAGAMSERHVQTRWDKSGRDVRVRQERTGCASETVPAYVRNCPCMCHVLETRQEDVWMCRRERRATYQHGT